jgi:hypothetical protein
MVSAQFSANQKIGVDTNVNLSGPTPIFNSVTIIEGNDHTIDTHGSTRIFMVGVDNATMIDHRWANSIIAITQNVAINDLTLANSLARHQAAVAAWVPAARCSSTSRRT